MGTAIGWYGPLIDVSKASSYIGHYVQLIVVVHKSTPVQYKIARNGGEVVRMDILVGDETRSFFPVTIWDKQMGSQVSAGHVYLLQSLRFSFNDLKSSTYKDVKITKFRDAVEARALHCSTLQCLFHSKDFSSSKGIDELVQETRLGITAKEKLQKVVGWLQRTRLTHCGSLLNYYDHSNQLNVNWKVPEEMRSKNCTSLSELCLCADSSMAIVQASVGEIFLPITWMNLDETEYERMFISRRLHVIGKNSLVDDLIGTGCELCGMPVNSITRLGKEQNSIPLYCQRSSDHFHVVGTIYRPFMLYVWDDLKYLPVLVNNKAAELLFGNISAERVYSSYKKLSQKQLVHQNHPHDSNLGVSYARTGKEIANPRSLSPKMHRAIRDKKADEERPNFCKIWLILLRALFQHGKNSPLKFKVSIDANKDWESGRFEMVSISIPAFRVR